MTALGLALASGFQHAQARPWVQEAIHASKLVTCAVVMHAVWSMAKVFCSSGRERLVATLSWLALCPWTSPRAPVARMAVKRCRGLGDGLASLGWVDAVFFWGMPAHGPAPSGQPLLKRPPRPGILWAP